MTNKYIWSAGLLILAVFSTYSFHFYHTLNYPLSDSPEVWGQLGDYVGGLLNPLLTFISLVLLIKSLALQNDANTSLRDEIHNTRKTEKLRSFENQLFNMLNSQKSAFDSFKIEIYCDEKGEKLNGAEAVMWLEVEIEKIRKTSEDDALIVDFLEEHDPTDQIFGLTRIFYNMVKLISEKLSDSNGFDTQDRSSHYLTLINFTDFSLLSLIVISAQFMNYASTDYLKNNDEFNVILTEVDLGYNLY